jgi:predicted DNA binding CopG/RHH family protein
MTGIIANPKNDSIVSAKSMMACSRCGSPTALRLFGSSAPAIGAKEKPSMSAKIKYTDEHLGKVQVVPDFLPSPAELAFREEGVKVTLALSKKSIEFFKSEAMKHHTQYQRMIRRLLDA